VYKFHSADGLNSKNSFRDEELLLSDKVDAEEDRILVVQSNYGFLGIVLGEQAEKTVMQDTSARACEYSRKNAEENSLENYKVSKTALEDLKGEFDKIIYAPAGYENVDVVKNRLAEAALKLRDNGELHIAGRKKTGLKRYRDFLKQYGEIEKTGRDGSVKAYRFTKNDTPLPPEITKNFKAEVNGVEAEFVTEEGLFSAGKLDDGTRLLLENLENVSGKVLDLACGYGAVSAFIGKSYSCDLFLTDDNARATKYARENLERNNVKFSEIKTADCLDGFKNKKFDYIVSNPPTHAGKTVTSKIFTQAYNSLKKGGEFWIVYNQNMNYEEELNQKFGSVEEVEREGNFKVVRAVK
ncbi:MAG: methyltransferase, partial [Candidatus Nanohaloarchaea archaeon]